MKNKIFTLLILCSSIIASGQNATLLKNYNPKVKELKHLLNPAKDSLILECETTILKVDFHNEDYEKVSIIESNHAKIALNDMLEGKFVVEVKLIDKIVVMHVIIHQDFNDTFTSITVSNQKEIVEGRGMMLDEGLNVITSAPKISLEYILNRGNVKAQTQKSKTLYWTVIRVNNESGSHKTMRLVDKKAADRMILRNKSEHHSALGKHNELTVWEVYNTSKFMEHQLENPDFIYAINSEYFNTTPYFTSKQTGQNL